MSTKTSSHKVKSSLGGALPTNISFCRSFFHLLSVEHWMSQDFFYLDGEQEFSHSNDEGNYFLSREIIFLEPVNLL